MPPPFFFRTGNKARICNGFTELSSVHSCPTPNRNASRNWRISLAWSRVPSNEALSSSTWGNLPCKQPRAGYSSNHGLTSIANQPRDVNPSTRKKATTSSLFHHWPADDPGFSLGVILRLRLAPAIGEIERVVAPRDRTRATPFNVSPTRILIRWRGGLRCEIDEPPVVGTCVMAAGFAAPSRVRPPPPRAEGKRGDCEGSQQYHRVVTGTRRGGNGGKFLALSYTRQIRLSVSVSMFACQKRG